MSSTNRESPETDNIHCLWTPELTCERSTRTFTCSEQMRHVCRLLERFWFVFQLQQGPPAERPGPSLFHCSYFVMLSAGPGPNPNLVSMFLTSFGPFCGVPGDVDTHWTVLHVRSSLNPLVSLKTKKEDFLQLILSPGLVSAVQHHSVAHVDVWKVNLSLEMEAVFFNIITLKRYKLMKGYMYSVLWKHAK